MPDEIYELEEWYGAKIKRTGFGYRIKLKFGTINIYTDSVKELEKGIIENLPRKTEQVTRKKATPFEKFWKLLLEKLGTPTHIRNWTVYSGYLGEDFIARKYYDSMIECLIPNGSPQYVPKKDFKLVYEVWENYKSFKVKRADLCQHSRFTKYVISIIHQFEELRYKGDEDAQ
ncbi:hypothetical protein Asulf_01410 [Archaeoglobus sulfaticallidus PM70-1]|uniref:Uncharacterized protein n=1 Tax=Archaeoglobus sulfaticallidus PM70-1 TaxID=387631 RepID=N0BGH5_9EURY|nr:hypothetical protein [Archaeoglobus sulfaticallidus]AGK61397.1 hypothetical protein Asulf_01410 [Archaeoglobus sulfaticallidus PM70-1]